MNKIREGRAQTLPSFLFYSWLEVMETLTLDFSFWFLVFWFLVKKMKMRKMREEWWPIGPR
jgi:hypothetical protein